MLVNAIRPACEETSAKRGDHGVRTENAEQETAAELRGVSRNMPEFDALASDARFQEFLADSPLGKPSANQQPKAKQIPLPDVTHRASE